MGGVLGEVDDGYLRIERHRYFSGCYREKVPVPEDTGYGGIWTGTPG